MSGETSTPVGVRVSDVSLGDVTPAAAPGLRRLIAVHGLVVFSHQRELDRAVFAALLRMLGRAGPSAGPKVAGLQDPSASAAPAAVVTDRPVRWTASPTFSDQHRAFDTLPRDVRDWLLTRSVRYNQPGSGRQGVSEHQLFRQHPLTGRVVLHLPQRVRGSSVSGLPDDVAAETISYLLAHSTAADNVVRHPWSVGDVLLWDSWSVRCKEDRAHGSARG